MRISPDVARRYILGRQGLWPGRRWRGARGTESAMRAMEHLQLDPLVVVARSQDLALHSRVLDYRLGLWEEPTYRKRRFFDWGGWLAVRPMEELPYWRFLMHHERRTHPSLREVAREHAGAIREMRALLRDRETVANRDVRTDERRRVSSYRARKDSALALYYLWRIGEVMIHHRERFERVYALTERVAPPDLIRASTRGQADRYYLRKLAAFRGLHPFTTMTRGLGRFMPTAEVQRQREGMLDRDEIAEIQVEGWKLPQYALAADLPILQGLCAGRLPRAWKPVGPTTEDEVLFLAPLDPVSARGRARDVFDFDYVWEVYKPSQERRWGYYTIPILWGDRLVGRMDPRLDREDKVLHINGLWLEDARLSRDKRFARAMANGLERLARLLGARRILGAALTHASFRRLIPRVGAPAAAAGPP